MSPLWTLLCFIYLFYGAKSFNEGDYPNSMVLQPLNYTLYWRADVPNDVIYFGMKVLTTGWVCFSLSLVIIFNFIADRIWNS